MPITRVGGYHLCMSGASRDDRSQGIVSAAEGVPRNVCGCHCLTRGVRSKERRTVFFHPASGGMSGKRCSAYISHLEHACINPQSACFDSFAGPVIFRICVLKERKHSFGAVRGPGGHRSLIFFAVLRHCPWADLLNCAPTMP